MKIIGHRGARGIAPENTMVSLRKALTHGVDELEFDLRVTKDNVVILHHDPYIRDPDGNKILIADRTFKELRKHKADLLTFKVVLQDIGHPVPLYIEVKPDVPTQPIIDIVKTYLIKGWRPEYFLLASFSQKTLLELHRELPQIQKIINESWSSWRARNRANQLNTKRVSMNERWLWSGFIVAMHRGGWQLCAYPLNNPIKAHRWAKYGLYGAITDFPDLMDD